MRELLGELSIGAIAARLRADLQALTSDEVAARAEWLREAQQAGCKTPQQFDANALTFIVSSWDFDWEGADFGAAPIAFDHGCHVPVVGVIVPRSRGDGVLVTASGPRESVEQFARLIV